MKRPAKFGDITNVLFIWALSLGSITITATGLLEQKWPFVLPWTTHQALIKFMVLLSALFIIFYLLKVITRTADLLIAAFIASLIIIISSNIIALLSVVLFMLSSIALGKTVCSFPGILNGQESLISQFLVGAGLYGTLISLLAHFPINYPIFYLLILLLPILIVIKNNTLIKQEWHGRRYYLKENSKNHRIDFISALTSAVAIIHLIVALLPELGFDALIIHLRVPSNMWRQHQWSFDPSLYVWSLMPMFGDWLYSIVYMLAGESGARLLNLGFIYLMAYQGFQITRWLGGSLHTAKLTVLLFLTTPLTFTESNSLYVEAVWGVFVIAGIMALTTLIIKHEDQTDKDGSECSLRTVALIWGFACATKAITLAILPLAVILIMLSANRLIARFNHLELIIAAIFFISVASIPYITSWIISGNPVFPFFNGIFKSPYYPEVNFNNPLYNSGLTWDILYRMIFNSSNYLEATNGAAGFQWLLLLPVSIFLLISQRNSKAIVLIAVTFISVVLIFHSQAYLRYIFPFFLIIAAVITAAMKPKIELKPVQSSLLTCMIAGTIGLNILFFPSATWTYRDLPLHALINPEEKAKFLETKSPTRVATDIINELNISQTPVAAFTISPFGEGLNADVLYPTWHNYNFQDSINSISSADDLIAVLSKYNANYIILGDYWRNEKKRKIIENTSDEIKKIGYISIRRISVAKTVGGGVNALRR